VPRYGLYQPFVEDRNVRRLYRLKVAHRRRTGKKVPMTVLINRILDDFFAAEEAPEARVIRDDTSDAAASPS